MFIRPIWAPNSYNSRLKTHGEQAISPEIKPNDSRVSYSMERNRERRNLPATPPPSAGVLAKYVLAYARTNNLAENRVRAWISFMITAGTLERALTNGTYQGFSFRKKREPLVLDNGAALTTGHQHSSYPSIGLTPSIA